MAHWVCENCGADFIRDKAGSRPIRFCGQICYHAFRKQNSVTKGQFEPGSKPWNKGLKGIHLSPETEFKKGRKSEKAMPFGSVTIRNDKAGKPRAWVKQKTGWVPRAQAVYTAANGAIPDGHVLHHLDGDTLNDRLANLKPLTPADHVRAHHAS